MISPKATHLLIRHLDAIDRAVTKRTLRKRPWLEPAITSLLCDLMDEETQADEHLEYTVEELNRDLAEQDGLLAVRLHVETHEFHPKVERWITQSDVGFILRFQDHLLPQESWSRAWLFQAKRVEPDNRKPVIYSEVSHVTAIDKAQRERMLLLDKLVGGDFVRYLLYCPRPESLEELTRLKLWRLRQLNVANQIFDFALGLELHDEASRADSTLAAGLFTADVNQLPSTLGEIHRSVFEATLPLSWFIAGQFFDNGPTSSNRFGSRHMEMRVDSSRSTDDWRCGIVRGDEIAVNRVLEQVGVSPDGVFPFLPPHTLTVEVSVGTQLNSDTRFIRGLG